MDSMKAPRLLLLNLSTLKSVGPFFFFFGRCLHISFAVVAGEAVESV